MSYIYPASAVCIFLFGHCNWPVWSLASRFFDKLILDHVAGHNIIFLLMINQSIFIIFRVKDINNFDTN